MKISRDGGVVAVVVGVVLTVVEVVVAVVVGVMLTVVEEAVSVGVRVLPLI